MLFCVFRIRVALQREGFKILRPQYHVCSFSTGAIYVDGSGIVLKGEALFTNNTADFGGTAVKRTIWCTRGNLKKRFSKNAFGRVSSVHIPINT